MKKAFTVALILTVCCTMVGFAGTRWQFVKVFPDTGIAYGTGVHGIAVDPAGKIWVGPFGRTNNDSLENGKPIVAVYVYNPDGTEAAISRIKMISTTGRTDTLSGGSIRGMRTDMDGNVVVDGYYNTGGDGASKGHYWKLDYTTGAGLAHVGLTGSLIAPAFTSANEMFTGNVAPAYPLRIWAGDFSSLGDALPSESGYSRTIEVSKDGNDIYQCRYSLWKIYKYHSDNGTLGPYTLVDSLALGCAVESIAWNNKDGYLYFSSGPVDTINYPPGVKAPWTHTTWYAMDVATKEIKDSISWNWGAYPYNLASVDLGPRPRGIDFSVTGDTAYVATYNHAKAAIQMFVRVLTSVEPVTDMVPNEYTLSQNYPNPFNPSTEIQFTLTNGGLTTLKVYDLLGKEIATLVNEELNAGTYKTKFDASRLASGTYIYSLTANGVRLNNKMLLMK